MSKNKELLGGQAIIEGVMMKSPKRIGYAVYNPAGKIKIKSEKYKAWKNRFSVLGWPLIRGFVNLIEMMMLGLRALNYSLSIAAPEEYSKQSKYEMSLSLLLSFGFSFGLFVFLPAAAFTFFKPFVANTVLLNLLEGLVRISIFVIFLLLVGLEKDMARIFGYHGAEHMTVYAYEAGKKLTVQNVKKYSTLHPRCGTSFIMIVFLVSILVFSLLGRPDLYSRIFYKILLLPLIAGLSYELIRLVCLMPKMLGYFFLWPGLLMQKLTTRKPDQKMIRAAIAALQQAGGVK